MSKAMRLRGRRAGRVFADTRNHELTTEPPRHQRSFNKGFLQGVEEGADREIMRQRQAKGWHSGVYVRPRHEKVDAP